MTAAGVSLGTPQYMAPEQAAADPNTDHRADIYALGIVGYEMLAGVPPFHGRSQHELLRAQLTEPPQPLASRRYDVPVALSDLIMQSLEKSPDARPKQATDMVRVLESSEAVSGQFASPGAIAKKRATKYAWILAAGVLIAAAAGYFAYSNSSNSAAPVANRLEMYWLETIGLEQDTLLSHTLTADLSNALAAVQGLRVIPPVDPLALLPADSTRGLAAMRLTGTVQREGTRVRVNLRLSRIANDSTLWVGRYDGVRTDLLTLQDDIAAGAADGVRRQLGGR
jgi:serine/threonine-protein kinase